MFFFLNKKSIVYKVNILLIIVSNNREKIKLNGD